MKKAFLFVFIGLILLAIPATVFLVGKNQELRKRAAPATTLSFSPAKTSVKVGETFQLDVQVNTADNQVVAAELHILFDPEFLEAQTITNGALAPTILTSGTVEGGTASITVGAASAAAPISGRGSLAVIRFKALKASPSAVSIRFASNTFLGALGESAQNVLVGSTGATVTILNADGTRALVELGEDHEESSKSATLTPTPTQVLTPVPTSFSDSEGTQSAQASASALIILSPEKNESFTTGYPTFAGTAPPGSTVTLTIYSAPQTVVVTVDEDGTWTYTPTNELSAGPHTVVATSTDASGATYTATTNFVVAAAGDDYLSSGSAMPIAGSAQTTIALIISGLVLLLSGMLIPILFSPI